MRLFAVLVVTLSICLGPAQAWAFPGGERGSAPQPAASARQGAPAAPILQDLTDDEAGWLLRMWEEERLAQEVYLALFAQWGSRIFSNIAASEAQHVAAVRRMLDRYGLAPEAEPQPGVFPTLQAEYDGLVSKGLLSVQDAYEVGVEIEEMDIADLGLAMDATDNADIDKVYANLLAGSLRHLAAFTSHLEPVSLAADEAPDALAIDIVVSPSTINIASRGTWVTVHADIDFAVVAGASVTLNGLPVVATFADDCGDLVAKFYVDDVKGIVEPGTADLALSGTTRDGESFSGTDAVKVVNVVGKAR